MDKKSKGSKRRVEISFIDDGTNIPQMSQLIGTSTTNLKRKCVEEESNTEESLNHNVDGPKKPKCEYKLETDDKHITQTNDEENNEKDIGSTQTNLSNKTEIKEDKSIGISKECKKHKGRKRDAKEYIVEVTQGVMSKKIIIADKRDSGQYGIDWDKYIIKNNLSIDEQIFNYHGRKRKPKKTSLDEPSTSGTSFQSRNLENETDNLSNCDSFDSTSFFKPENTLEEMYTTTRGTFKFKAPSPQINPSSQPKLPHERKKRVLQKKGPVKHVPKYTVIEKFQTDDENQIQIKMETAEAVQNKTKDHINKTLVNFFEEQKLTYRVIKRVNFILKMVKQNKVIVDTMKLVKAIRDAEIQEGVTVGIDRKSIIRLLLKLSEYGLIKYRKATLKSESTEKKVTFICDVSVDDEDSVITSVLEQSKMKYFIMTKEKTDDQIKAKKRKEMELESPKVDQTSIPNVVTEDSNSKPSTDVGTNVGYKYNRTISKKYGLRPKFARCRIIHEFLYYIIYDKQSNSIPEPDELHKIFQEYGGSYQIFENSNPAPVYNQEISWKMFIPPLIPYTSWPKGWVILSDILLRLPLYILTNCFNIPFEIPHLEEYIAHPIRKNFLIKNLPPAIRNGLMYGKKLTYILIENLRNLSYLGLIQFGPQKLKEKDQLFIYLNRRATLYNTVASTPGYVHISDDVEYDKIDYTFSSFQDVEQYWYDMWSICINTPLGYRSSLTGEYVIIENSWAKPELMNCTSSRTPEEVEHYDNGDIPGDGKGAAGFDTTLFAHLKRNWNWMNALPCGSENRNIEDQIKKIKKEKSSKQTTVEKTKEISPQKTVAVKEEPKTKSKKFKIKPIERKEKIRLVPAQKPKKKKLEYDEKDKLCLARMRKLRTDWYEVENHVVLLCAVASTYLCPNYRKQRIEQYVFRDILHKMVPNSNDKTSRAVHRRIRYVMKNPKTRKSVFTCLEEIKHCEYVTEKFGSLVKKYHNSVIPELTLIIAFTELVGFLNLKFANKIPKNNTTHTNIPDTVKEMREQYDLIVSHKKPQTIKAKDIESIYDIECETVKSVIHSSLCSTKDKTSWAFQLFKIYQQYPDSMLRHVINKIRLEKMASMKKSGLLKIRASTTSSILQSPFKLSIYYIYQLQNTKFSFKSLSEANAFTQNFMQSVNSEEFDGAYDITCSDHGTSLIIENALRRLNLEIVFEHPEQVIILDPILKEDKTYERILKKYYDILKAQNGINLDENKHNSDSDEDNTPHVEYEQQSLNTEIKNPSRIGFHMMRADMFDHNEKNNVQHMHDYFVVQVSKMFLKPKDPSSIIQYEKTNKKKVNKVVNEIKSSVIIPDSCNKFNSEDIKAHFSDLNLTTHDLEYVEKIKCHIRNAKELGLTLEELKLIPPDAKDVSLTLKNILNFLSGLHIILRVGKNCMRYVHYDFKKPWITHADKILRLQKEKMSKDLIPTKWKGKHILKSDEHRKDQKLKILVAPWVRFDGSINRRVLDRWLGTFVSLCVEEPGIKLQDLIARIAFLKATETIFLVEQLVKIDCVKLIKVKKPKITLFSEMADYSFEETDILEDPNEVIIEPTEDAFFNFSIFLGAKNYNHDFVD